MLHIERFFPNRSRNFTGIFVRPARIRVCLFCLILAALPIVGAEPVHAVSVHQSAVTQTEADALAQAGLAAYQNGDYEDALEQLEMAHQIYGKLGQWWNQLGLNLSIASAQQKVDEAIENNAATLPPQADTETDTGTDDAGTDADADQTQGPADVQSAETIREPVAELEALFDQGNDLRRATKFSEALDAYRSALDIAQTLDDDRSAARLLERIGMTYQLSGEVSSALDAYDSALAIWTELNENNNALDVLIEMADIERTRQEMQAALELYQQAKELLSLQNNQPADAEETDNLRRMAVVQTAIGDITYSQETYTSAKDAYLIAAPAWQALADNSRQIRALRNAARSSDRIGDRDTAVEIYLTAIDAAQTAEAFATQASLLNEVGNVYRSLEQYNDALAVLEVSISISEMEEGQVEYANALMRIGDVYRDLGNDEDAIISYQEALTLMLETGEVYTAARLTDTLASYSAQLNKPQEASELYLVAAERWQSQGRTGSQVKSLRNAARSFAASSDADAAISTYLDAVTAAENSEDALILAQALNDLGNAYRTSAMYDKALDSLVQARIIWLDEGDSRNLLSTLGRIADTYRDMGDEEAALAGYLEALTIAKGAESRSAEASLLETLGSFYVRQEKHQEALGYFQDARRLWNDLESTGREIRSLRSIADVYGRLNDEVNGTTAFQEALALAQMQNDSGLESNLLGRLARHYANFGLYSDAIAASQAEVEIWKNLEESSEVVSSLIRLAGTYARAGQGANLRQTYFQALTLATDSLTEIHGDGAPIDDTPDNNLQSGGVSAENEAPNSELVSRYNNQIATIQDALGGYYRGLRQYPEALTYYQQALAKWQTEEEAGRTVRTLSAMASTYSGLGNKEQATQLYLQALNVTRSADSRTDEANILTALGRHYSSLEQYPEAVNAYRGAFAIWNDLEALDRMLSTRQSIWSTYVRMREYGAALDWATDTVGIMQPFNGASVSNIIDIEGLAGHPEFDKWQIDLLANGDEAQASYIGRGTRPSWGRLLALDTTIYPNGPYTIRLRIVKEGKNYDEYFSNIIINNNLGNQLPRHDSGDNGFIVPAQGAAIFGLLRIEGIAVHEKFDKWQLDLLPFSDAAQAQHLQTGSRPSRGRLYTLDTQAFPNGNHRLRLRVVRNDGNYDEFFVNFTINN